MVQAWQAATQVLWSVLFVLAVEFVVLGFFLRVFPFFRRLGRDLLLLATASAIPVWLSAWNPFLGFAQPQSLPFQALFSLAFCSFLASSAFTAADTYALPRFKWLSLACVAAWLISLSLAIGDQDAHLPGAILPWEIAFAGAVLFTLLGLLVNPSRHTGTTPHRLTRFLARCYWLPALSSWNALLLEAFWPVWSIRIWLAGHILYGALGVYLFAEHLVGLYAEQEELLLKTAETNQSLDREKPLQELGRNTAEVSREIQGFASQLQTLVQGLFSTQGAGRNPKIERIERARQGLERYTQDILDYAASFNVRLEDDVDLPSWLQAELERQCMEFGLEPVVYNRSEPIPMRVDALYLRKALGQICRNSKEAGARRLEATISRADNRVTLVLMDDGPGCSPELRDNALTPFFTTKKNMGACGLGLAIADQVLRGHGGSLWVESGVERKSEGLGFTVRAEWQPCIRENQV